MCGIGGILTDRNEINLHESLAAMRSGLRHRGPDDEGQCVLDLPGGRRLGLAQTRLSILDLSPAGHQPMHDPPSDCWVVYNGEIYNHAAIRRELPAGPYRSTGDTETLLRAWGAWGPAVIDRCRGMFAFGLYDARRRQFWLVRDRMGIKPLYVARPRPGLWVFASELRSLLASGLVERRIDPDGLRSFLALGAVQNPRTLVAGVESVLPGQQWVFDLAAAALAPRRDTYWQPPFQRAAEGESVPSPSREAPRPLTEEEALEQLRPVLREAVQLRLVSDVPVGAFLSGGIDSSAVVALLTEQGQAVRTFSMVFAEERYSEASYARAVADRLGSDHRELRLTAAAALRDLDAALAAYDQPSIDGINTYFISRETRRAGVTVALSGLGGDELFGGYPTFHHLPRLERPGMAAAAWLAGRVPERLAPRSMRWQKVRALARSDRSRLAAYCIHRQYMLPGRRSALLGAADVDPVVLPPAERTRLAAAIGGLDPENATSLLEIAVYMQNTLLRDTDQMSMAHALEVRVPLIDHVVVETVAGWPGRFKQPGGPDVPPKRLLVGALDGRLPRAIVHRPKMGFDLPWDVWLRGPLRDRVGAVLTDAGLIERIGLRPGAVAALWGDYRAGRAGLRSSDVLGLLVLGEWARSHNLAR